MSSLSGTLRRGNTGGSVASGGTAAPSAVESGSTRIRGISSGIGFTGEFKSGAVDVMSGRVSLLMLDTLVLLLLGFYVWTHNAQGGG